ncbi:hypothetical protein LTR66_013028 [Elasticomyces elasticus]|nr:hypothetical protein LTR66_013028 [Elasticomyces elasticus]KAK4962142.1 hypothetical protein LTR28_004738 [Elasticomyces elasticus]
MPMIFTTDLTISTHRSDPFNTFNMSDPILYSINVFNIDAFLDTDNLGFGPYFKLQSDYMSPSPGLPDRLDYSSGRQWEGVVSAGVDAGIGEMKAQP